MSHNPRSHSSLVAQTGSYLATGSEETPVSGQDGIQCRDKVLHLAITDHEWQRDFEDTHVMIGELSEDSVPVEEGDDNQLRE